MQLRTTRLTAISSAAKKFIATFSPSSLFANSEPGIWLDPSDIERYTTPLGPELVTNGNFSNGTTGWSTPLSGASITGGALMFDGVTSIASGITIVACSPTVSIVANRWYRVTYTIASDTTLPISVGFTVGNVLGTARAAAGTYTEYLLATSNANVQVISRISSGARTGSVDNISVRELTAIDTATMFQDAAGTTPVTAVGQPVGLMLDKSRGLVLGSELATGSWGNSASVPFDSFSAAGGGFTATKSVSGSQQQASIGSFAITADRAYYFEIVFSANTFTANQLAVALATGSVQRSTASIGVSAGASIIRGYLFANSTQAAASLRIASISASTGSVAVTSATVRELPGNHATQTTSTSRPVLQQDGSGKYYLQFDGVDDWLITPTITPGVDKVQVFAGVRKLSNAIGIIAEVPAIGWFQSSGTFAVGATTSGYFFASRGTVSISSDTAGPLAPITSVLTGLGDISGDSAVMRINGTQAAINTGNQGSGNFLAYQVYIGRRGGAEVPFNGHLYGLIVRFGSNLPAGTIASTETWLNGKTGAY